MNIRSHSLTISTMAVLFLFFTCLGSGVAAEVKVGIMNMQKVLASSEAGKKAQAVIDARMKELRDSFKTEEEDLIALQQEIEKKSSAWSEEMKKEKAMEFQKKRRDIGVKQEDANLEMKNLRDKHLEPILKSLEKVVEDYAKREAYTVILPRNTVLYFDDAIDISEAVTAELNKQMK